MRANYRMLEIIGGCLACTETPLWVTHSCMRQNTFLRKENVYSLKAYICLSNSISASSSWLLSVLRYCLLPSCVLLSSAPLKMWAGFSWCFLTAFGRQSTGMLGQRVGPLVQSKLPSDWMNLFLNCSFSTVRTDQMLDFTFPKGEKITLAALMYRDPHFLFLCLAGYRRTVALRVLAWVRKPEQPESLLHLYLAPSAFGNSAMKTFCRSVNWT